MIYHTPRYISRLIENFERLPGIGPKSATRLAYYLMCLPQKDLDDFAQSLSQLKSSVSLCERCFIITENIPCEICQSPERDPNTIIVVEQPLDVISFERVGDYRGHYHVLHGVIAPLRHIGPDDIMIKQLLDRARNLAKVEIILAMNNTLEGETTALYLARALKDLGLDELKVTRLAKGLPTGAEVEFADEITLRKALEGRMGV